MTIHDIWNECVNNTNNVSSCLELYTKQIREDMIELFEKHIMPNGDNSNPCMKCGAIQCARCGHEMLNEFGKIKKEILGDEQTIK